LWKFTADYLRNTKKLHNILYVYNTAEFTSKEHFLERYPGDDYVDVISFDTYQHPNAISKNGNDFIKQTAARLDLLNEIALERKKIPAFAETGFEGIPQADWWTSTLLPLLRKHPLSYVLVWRNAGLMKETGKMHFYAPYPGHSSAADFIKFYKDDKMLFEKKIKNEMIYQSLSN
jgi:mannan endo-1,4-beta-mannosidase